MRSRNTLITPVLQSISTLPFDPTSDRRQNVECSCFRNCLAYEIRLFHYGVTESSVQCTVVTQSFKERSHYQFHWSGR